MTTEPLNPSVTPLYGGRYSENTSGIIAAIVACIEAAGGAVMSYPANTAGIIQALIDLQVAITGGGSGTQSVASLAPTTSGEALVTGDAVYISSADGKVYKATSTYNFESANILGLVKTGVAAADLPVTIVVRGPCGGLSGLSTGKDYFLGLSGGITETPPGGGGIYSVMIGQAIAQDKIDVQPMPPILTT